MAILSDNTMNLRTSIIEEVREQQQPVLEAAAKAEQINGRLDTVDTVVGRVEALIIDVERFVPAAATRADAWQAAIDTAETQGGGTVTSSLPGDHVMGKGITLADNVYLDIPTVHLDFSGITAPASPSPTGRDSCIGASGSLTALPSLSSPPAKDSDTLTFSASVTLNPGDVVLLYDPTDYSFAPFRDYYRAGEFCRVLASDGTTVTTTTPRYATYAGTAVAYKLEPVHTGIRGGSMTFRAGYNGITVYGGDGLEFSNLNLSGTDQSHLEFRTSIDVHCDRVKAVDYQADVALNYGIQVSNSQHVTVSRCHLETTRHGLVTGGGFDIGPPVRDLTISESYISSTDDSFGDCGLNLHGNIEWTKIVNCTLPRGFNIAGDHVLVQGNTISTSRSGHIVHGQAETLGADFQFLDNTFIATAAHRAEYAHVNVRWSSSGTLTRTGGDDALPGQHAPHG